MSASIAAVSAKVTADASVFKAEMNAAGKAAQDFKRSGEGLHNVLRDIKKVAGGRSEIAELVHTLAGAGAVAGATALAQHIGEAAVKVHELADAFEAGQASAQDVAAGFARSVPVLGTFIGAWDKIIHGDEDAYWKRNAEAAERYSAAIEKVRDKFEQLKDTEETFGKSGAALDRANEAQRLRNELTGIRKISSDYQNKVAYSYEPITGIGESENIATLDKYTQLLESRAKAESKVRLELIDQAEAQRGLARDIEFSRDVAKQWQDLRDAQDEIKVKEELEEEAAALEDAAARAEEYAKAMKEAEEATAAATREFLRQKEEAAKSLETPLEKFQQDIADLQEQMHRGIIDRSQFEKLAGRRSQDFFDSQSAALRSATPRAISTVEMGSQAAAALVARTQADSFGPKTQAEKLQAIKEYLARQEQIQREMLKALENLKIVNLN